MQTLIIFKRVSFDHKSASLSTNLTTTKLMEATIAITMVAIMQYLLIYKHDYSSFSS